MRYCDFFSGSFAGSDVVADEEAPPLGAALLLGEELPEALGDELLAPPLALGELAPELGDEALGDDEELAPPEAEPEAELDLDGSLEAELDFDASLAPDPLVPAEELDEDEGLVGEDEAPLDGDELGEDAVLELEEPGLEEVLLESPPRSHAASPNARATAAARMETLMCPPWLGTRAKSRDTKEHWSK